MKFAQIPQDTFEAMQLEAGMLLKNFDPSSADAPADEDIICATTGGISVSCTPSFSDMGEDVDNAPVNVMELMKLDNWVCTIAFTALSTSAEFIKTALGVADISGNKVTPRGDLEQTDFQDVWWVGDKAGGGWVAAKLLNALSTSGLSLKTTKSGKGQISVTLTGHVSVKAQDVVPMEFYTSVESDADAASVEDGNEEVGV